jgi:hypothetical protein
LALMWDIKEPRTQINNAINHIINRMI